MLVRAGLLSLSFLLGGGPLVVPLGAHVFLSRVNLMDQQGRCALTPVGREAGVACKEKNVRRVGEGGEADGWRGCVMNAQSVGNLAPVCRFDSPTDSLIPPHST